MKKQVSLLSVTVLFLLSGCYMGVPLKIEPAANNSSYQVDYLFEHDGCKVYRFYDQGRYVYFTNSQGTVSAFQNDSTKTVVTNQVFIEEGEN